MPKALPGPSRDADTHDRIRHDIVGKSGTVTLRRRPDLEIGQPVHVPPRPLTIDPSKNYQPLKRPEPTYVGSDLHMSWTSHGRGDRI